MQEGQGLSGICTKKCADILGKIFQVLVIDAIGLYVMTIITNVSFDSKNALYIVIIVYILYIIIQFRSTAFSFLCNKTNESGIKNTLAALIQTFPTISFFCECYHYETVRTYSPPKKGGGRKGGSKKGGKKSGGKKTVGKSGGGGGRKSGGGTHRTTHYRNVKRVTWSETVFFPYYSARDVSGLFQLNNSREQAMGKVYIKLEINPEINFADEVSYMDYENFRNNFYNRTRSKDQYMNYRETREVPGLQPYNFVCIRNQEPCGVNICMFIFFTIIPLAELYKCYINSYCLEQHFKIRKIISTRYDLNVVNQEQYQYLIPSIDVPDQQYAFQPNNYNYINNDYKVKLPTAKEIAQAEQYKNKLPNYQCVSYTSLNDGQIKVGVVQDDPAYCSVNINDAPPPTVQNVSPSQPGPNANNNMMNMNVNPNNPHTSMNVMDNGIDSNNNMNNNNIINNNMNKNMNNNMNYNDDDDDDDDDISDEGDKPYVGT